MNSSTVEQVHAVKAPGQESYKKLDGTVEFQQLPVTVQPTIPAVNVTSTPRITSPPGLEYLTTIDQLLIHQKIEMLEVFTGCETKNKYDIKNSIGQQIYSAIEDSDCCARICCGPIRPFIMKIYDNSSNEIIHMHRPLNGQGCCFPCCLQKMEVYGPPGNLLGTVEEDWSFITPKYSIKNASGDIVLKIVGPCCVLKCCSDIEYNVFSVDGISRVGKITKQWSGLAQEIFTSADNFGITFPLDLAVEIKAVLLGACFLIDMMYFEHKNSIFSN